MKTFEDTKETPTIGARCRILFGFAFGWSGRIIDVHPRGFGMGYGVRVELNDGRKVQYNDACVGPFLEGPIAGNIGWVS